MNTPLKEIDPDVATFIEVIAEKHGLFCDKARKPWELPRGVTMNRFRGDGFVKLVGQYVNEAAIDNAATRPRRVYEITVAKELDYQLVDITEDGDLIAEMKVFRSAWAAEYMALKCLKAHLNRAAKHSVRKMNQRHKRAALKAAAKTESEAK